MKSAEIYHNSHDIYYRDPFGAVEAGTIVHLRLRLAKNIKMKAVYLRVWQEQSGERLIKMRAAETDSDCIFMRAELPAAAEGCLIWYYFMIELADGKTIYYGNNERQQGGEGMRYDQLPPSYQLTVYDKGARTPDWFKGAVMYQIFPDRFCRAQTEGLPQKRDAVYHLSWQDKPFYFKDVDTKEIIAYDFYGGNLAGIQSKLAYLKELGIGVIYMNPIFQAQSNHRYDTGDYHTVDPLLGTNDDLKALCEAASEQGIRIILDGVFSHTGSDSKYFNRYGHYDSVGAYQSPDSPYREWYDFIEYPKVYNSWWGFDTLPNVQETTPSYMDFMIYKKDSVLKYWLGQGVSGWRLDVIDELPPKFSQAFFRELKHENPDNVLIGEVWEDASNKQSYGVPREYLCGHEMDSAMNYPFRKAVLDFLLGRADASATRNVLFSLYENYPKENFYAMMNLIGSHDVERVMTLLGEAPSAEGVPVIRQAEYKLPEENYVLAEKRLRMASLWQMTFPGVPCVYYGDEIGMQGYRDPYNRCPYEWEGGNMALRDWYKQIIALRNHTQAFKTGAFIPLVCGSDVFGYIRRIYNGCDVFGNKAEDDAYLVLFNRHKTNYICADIALEGIFSGRLQCLIGDEDAVEVCNGKASLKLAPLSGVVYRMKIDSKFDRGAGVLLHPTSLPGKHAIGDMGREAYRFVDFLAAAGQKFWQVLPLNPVACGDSPYQSPSAFAGNPALISLEMLAEDGLLDKAEIKPCRGADFAAVLTEKRRYIAKAYKRFQQKKAADYAAFCQEEVYWLDDYAVYMAIKDTYQKPWYTWPDKVKAAEPAALAREKAALSDKIDYYRFEQYVFFRQWRALKRYANERDIRIIGDMPIFVAHDSADVWANQSEFQLDSAGQPEKVAGVPPDYFSATGQLWGNPHYRWDVMRKNAYRWWKDRFKCLLSVVDVIRVDHFRGFESYWSVDGKAKTAMDGEWIKGPGQDFFLALRRTFGELPIIAEDLGLITNEVNELKDSLELPGMQVLHFAIRFDAAERVAFACAPNCIAYTGTHDNNTTVGWYEEDLNDEQRAALCQLLGVKKIDSHAVCHRLIEYLYACNASLAIVPMQDLLELDSRSRMNLPGSFGGTNWHWRLPQEWQKNGLADWLARLAVKNDR